MEKAWNNVHLSDQYAFAADVVIKTIPLPTAGNIGRFSKTDSLYLEGTNDLKGKGLEMALWGGGVSVANRDAAYQVRVRDGRTETRTGDGEWQSGEDGAASFAPGGDFLAFLDVAKNIALAGDQAAANRDIACTGPDCTQPVKYTFDLDGRAYAEKLARIAQEQMIRKGQLPPGASAQIPEHLANLTGSGELWVDARGLPVRQKVMMAIPAAAGADYRTETEMDIRFTGYKGYQEQLAAAPWLGSLAGRLARVDWPSAARSGRELSASSRWSWWARSWWPAPAAAPDLSSRSPRWSPC